MVAPFQWFRERQLVALFSPAPGCKLRFSLRILEFGSLKTMAELALGFIAGGLKKQADPREASRFSQNR